MAKRRRTDMSQGVAPVAEMERLLDRTEVARMLGCKADTLRTMWQQDRFPRPLYVSKSPRWRLKEVVHWIDEQAAKRDA